MIEKYNIPKQKRNNNTISDGKSAVSGGGTTIINNYIDVVNNLLSTSSSDALAARQGKILNETKLDKSSVSANLHSTSTTDALAANQGKLLNDSKLSKNLPDTAKEVITFDKGLVSKSTIKTFDFGPNTGASIYKDDGGKWNIEIDKAKIRGKLEVQELDLNKAQYVGGSLVCTLASIKITRVEPAARYYRCYFNNKADDGTIIENCFAVGDLVYSQTFKNNKARRWWRGVMSTGADYIDLASDSVENAFEPGSDIPVVGDVGVQLGNATNVSRQNAIIVSSVDTPSIVQYKGINDFTLAGKEVTVISPSGNKFTGDFISKNTGRNLESVIKQTADEINLTINEIQIGGVNLYQSNTQIGVYSRGGDNSTNEVLNQDKNGFYLIGSKKSDAYAYVYTNLQEPGPYTISFKTKTNGPKPIQFNVFGTYKTKEGKNKDVNIGTAYFKPNYEISEVQSFTLDVKAGEFKSDVNFWMSSLMYTTYMLSDVKIEKGNKATAWTPSPYDDEKELLETGINIKDKEITVTADKFNVKGSNGTIVADFITDKNGVPVIKAPNLDIDNIKAENCNFKYGSMSGILLKEPIYITPDNLKDYLVYDEALKMDVLDLTKLGSLIVFKGQFPEEKDVTVNLLGCGNTANLTIDKFKYIGSQVVMINRSSSPINVCGATHSHSCMQLWTNSVSQYTCSIRESSWPDDGGFQIGWDEDFRFTLNEASPLNLIN